MLAINIKALFLSPRNKQLLVLGFASLFLILLIFWGIPNLDKSSGKINELQAKNRQLEQHLLTLQQQSEQQKAELIDTNTLRQIQDQVIIELREGNQSLEKQLQKIQKNIKSQQ